jgi:hypothetical protein
MVRKKGREGRKNGLSERENGDEEKTNRLRRRGREGDKEET